jgi:hypothetical protein
MCRRAGRGRMELEGDTEDEPRRRDGRDGEAGFNRNRSAAEMAAGKWSRFSQMN